MSGVAMVPQLVRAMVMEWEPEAEEPWGSNPPAEDRATETEATIDELAVVVARARSARQGPGAAVDAIEELIFEPTF